jgi:hypothetical protein
LLVCLYFWQCFQYVYGRENFLKSLPFSLMSPPFRVFYFYMCQFWKKRVSKNCLPFSDLYKVAYSLYLSNISVGSVEVCTFYIPNISYLHPVFYLSVLLRGLSILLDFWKKLLVVVSFISLFSAFFISLHYYL